MKKGRLPAYTLMEMTVVMLISAIVISILYTSFRILGSQYRNFKRNSEEMGQILRVDQLLSRDFFACQWVQASSEGLHCVYANKRINYSFQPAYILRLDHTVRDTFFLATSGRKFLWQGQEVAPGELLDELQFEHEYKEEGQTFRYRKVYGADLLMKQDKPKESHGRH